MSSDRIAITGTTGRVGGRVARLLSEQGVSLRLLARDVSRVPHCENAEVRTVDYDEPDEVHAGLEGVERLFFVSAPQDADALRTHDTFLSAAEAAGVQHVVYLSHYGAARDATYTPAIAHWHTERIIRDHFHGWTFVRDNLYADLLPEWLDEVGLISGPAKRGHVAPVAIDDIAAVVTKVLLDPAAHNHRTYELTGPEALTFAQVAELLQEASGRSCGFRQRSADDTYSALVDEDGVETWQAEARVTLFQAAAAGDLGDVTRDIERLLGRPAIPVRDVLAKLSRGTDTNVI